MKVQKKFKRTGIFLISAGIKIKGSENRGNRVLYSITMPGIY
jgi:hypothetical protein